MMIYEASLDGRISEDTRNEMLRVYTNISFTEKQLEDPQKLYDIIVLNNIWETVKDSIPEKERDYIWDNTCALAREITEYNHSALGILKLMSDDYENLNFDVQEITEKLSDRTNLDLVRNLLTKLV